MIMGRTGVSEFARVGKLFVVWALLAPHEEESENVIDIKLKSVGKRKGLDIPSAQFKGGNIYSSTIYKLQRLSKSWNANSGLFLLGLYTSMIPYRVFFHHLWAYPGPFDARVSKIWHVRQVRNAQNYLLMDRLHRQYGAFVRTGRLQLLYMTRSLETFSSTPEAC